MWTEKEYNYVYLETAVELSSLMSPGDVAALTEFWIKGGRWSAAATGFTTPTEVVPPDVLPVEMAVEAAEVMDMRCLGNCKENRALFHLVSKYSYLNSWEGLKIRPSVRNAISRRRSCVYTRKWDHVREASFGNDRNFQPFLTLPLLTQSHIIDTQ